MNLTNALTPPLKGGSGSIYDAVNHPYIEGLPENVAGKAFDWPNDQCVIDLVDKKLVGNQRVEPGISLRNLSSSLRPTYKGTIGQKNTSDSQCQNHNR